MSPENRENTAPAWDLPRPSTSGPNLATLGHLRALRKPRLLPAGARRNAVHTECAPAEGAAC